MAHQYWFNKGETKRTLYLSFDGGYHGDTFGAMSVGKKSHFHGPFQSLLFDIISIPFPDTWDEDSNLKCKEEEALDFLSNQLSEKGHSISAIIFEPLMQGASGMRICRPEFIRQVIDCVKSYDILVIYDEVITGFGRLGTYFAAEQIGIDPDFICISKGITGGFLPLSLTVTTKDIYNAFWSDNWDKAFLHGHSYTANPIACSAAIASFDLLVTERTKRSIKVINGVHKKDIGMLHDKCHNLIKHSRCIGTISAFDVNTVNTNDLNKHLKTEFLKNGLLLRPLGNTVYMLPPYSVTLEELENTYNIISEVIKQAYEKGYLQKGHA